MSSSPEPINVTHVIFFNELIKLPGTISLQLVAPIEMDKISHTGIVHQMLDDEYCNIKSTATIPGNQIRTFVSKKKVKKLLSWLENQSYSVGNINVLKDNIDLMRRNWHIVNVDFNLQNTFFDDIPDGSDGFKSI